MPSWTLPPCSSPDKLTAYMHALWPARADELDFVVLFGRTARGLEGELDLLLGLKPGDRRFLDRLQDFSGLGPGARALAYYPDELALMLAQPHLVLLDASDHGHVVIPHERWTHLDAELRKMRDTGRLERIGGGGWRVHPG